MTRRVLHVFPTFATGGAQVRTLALIDALGDAFRHAIVALDGRTEALAHRPNGARIELVPPLPKAGSPRTASWLAGLVTDRRPDLVCSYNWGAVDAVIALRVLLGGEPGGPALIHHEEGVHPDEALRQKARRTWARRALLPRVDALAVPSARLRDVALATWRLPPELVHLVPNGVPLDREVEPGARERYRAELGVGERVFLAGFVGPLRAEKNPARLARALAAAPPEVELLVVGDGPERPALEAVAADLGVAARIHLVGHRSDVAPWLPALDAFLLASDTEELPMALLEAMASGLPVVATDVGDVARTLPEEQRALLAPVDEDAPTRLAASLARLARAPDEARALGAANRARVAEHHSLDAMVARHRALWEAALARR